MKSELRKWKRGSVEREDVKRHLRLPPHSMMRTEIGAEGAVQAVVEHQGATIADFKPEFAAPLGECAFGDAEFGGDANEAPALRAELDKLLNCFLILHTSHATRSPEQGV